MERITVGDGYLAVRRYEADGGERGRCLLIPPFRVPADVLDPVARALVDRGFETAVVDPRNHVGEGSGGITHFRLSTFAEDCQAAIEAIRPTCLVAVSLGARAALRALGRGAPCPAAVLVTPVVEVDATLCVVLGRDWFGVPAGQVPPLLSVLGMDIDAPRFRQDCLDHDLVTADSTVPDAIGYDGRLHLIPGTEDPWVECDAVHRLADRLARPDRVVVRPVTCDRHAFHEDADLALRIVGALIEEVESAHTAMDSRTIGDVTADPERPTNEPMAS
ncbi:MAG: alpha/beta fold hydrolase [Actinomycetota bacterium]